MIKFNFSGKKVLITGGVSGIGFETAKLFTELGATVTVTCKSKSNFEKFKKKIEKIGIKVEKLDLTNEISIEHLSSKINKLDILINNAVHLKGGIEYRIENFADVVNVNLMGLMRICHTMLPKLALSKGNIVNISSANANIVFPNAPSYLATKGGIESLTKSMAVCWADHKVRVNSVAPGWIKGKTMDLLTKDYQKIDNLIDRIPLKRYGKPEEVANVIIFLSSTMASYISGSTIFVDGGYSIN